ncbi:MAG: sulfurtransferase [Terriglobia bacterium]
MRKTMLLVGLLAYGISFGMAQCDPGTPVTANAENSSTHNTLLVSTAWLEEHLKDQSLVLIHVGEKKDYEAGHIPGAQFLPYMDISTPHGKGLTLELPAVDELRSTLERLGISNNSRIVVYFGRDWVSPTTRVFFTLDFMGLGDQTSLLDGGLPAWQAEGRPVTQDIKKIQSGSLTPRARRDVVVDAAWVKSHLNNHSTVIVDARAPDFYSGKKSGGMPRSGHIPGAVNIPYSSLVNDNNKLKDPEALQQIFKAAGVKPDSHLVAYCHIGQQATLVYFVAKYLGYPVSLYDGSFEDWSGQQDLPLATGGSAPSGPQ